MSTEHTNQPTASEPFGYFKAEARGWVCLAKEEDGAIALYERPQTQPVARDVLMALAEEVRETCWQVGSGDATIRELDIAAIVDRYAAQPPAVAVAVPEAAVGKLRILLAACNRIEAGAEEFESQDGVEMAIAIDYWLEFIDALEAARAMLAAAPQAAVDAPNGQQEEPGPIIRQFGYQPLFNAISSATKWRDGRTIEISVLDFQEALLAAAQKVGDA